MGTSGDHATPAGAVDRSLFRKQSAREAHGSDFGIPGSGRDADKTLFRKNTLDEMTVRRTEKPVDGVKPVRREQIGLGSYEGEGERPAADQKRKGRRTGKTGRPGR